MNKTSVKELEAIPEVVRNRCIPIYLKRPSYEEVEAMIQRVCEQEKVALEQESLDTICKRAKSFREALQMLEVEMVNSEVSI